MNDPGENSSVIFLRELNNKYFFTSVKGGSSMDNLEFEKQCEELVNVRHFEASKIIGKILNKEGRDLEKSQAQIAILAYILPILIKHGCVMRTSTQEIAEKCGCKSTMVNNVLGFVGYKYDRDKVTRIKENESKGLFERFYQYEYEDDKCTKKKRVSSIFNIVATDRLFELLEEEYGLHMEVSKSDLEKIREDSKNKAYKEKVELDCLCYTIRKKTTTHTDVNGTTVKESYEGVKETINELENLIKEEPKKPRVRKPLTKSFGMMPEEDEIQYDENPTFQEPNNFQGMKMRNSQRESDVDIANEIIHRIKTGEITDRNAHEFIEECKLVDRVFGNGTFTFYINQFKRNRRRR